MPRLAPYQSGVWLAEYFNVRCQLCRVYRSTPQLSLTRADYLNIRHSLLTNLQSSLSRRLNNGLLCSHCHDSIAWLPEPFNVDIAAGTTLPIQAASYYDYPIRQAVRAFKHHEDMTKLPLLINTLRQLPRPNGCHADNSIIIPMPTTNSRLIKRGFDPVSILSAYLSQHWKIPLWQGAQRVDSTTSQQGLTRAERLTNLNSAFELIEPPPVKRLLLFDDVATTGASLQSLGRTLHSYYTNVASVNHQILSHSTTISPNNGYHLSAYALAHGSQ